MCRRLGVAVTFEASDPHGHQLLADGQGGRLHTRHREMVAAWRQVLQEAGGIVPDKNVERLLAKTHVPVCPDDLRRLDLIVPGLHVARGLPLFCDATVVGSITRVGTARSGTSNRGGALLEREENKNNTTYHEVTTSGLGTVLCLGCEVHGRWGRQSVDTVPRLAYARTEGMHPRIRRGMALGLQHRW